MDTELILLNIGVLLLLAMAAGKLVSLFKIPKVTGYLLLGLLLGPAIFGHFFPQLEKDILNKEVVDNFKIIKDIGLGLIIFNIGGEFKCDHFKKLGIKVLIVSAFEIILTFTAVALLSLLAFFAFFTIETNQVIGYSVILGIVAIATAPAATLLVLREYEAEGPVSEYILVLVGLNNIICILAFKVVFSFLFDEKNSFIDPFIDVLASVTLGSMLGLFLSVVEKWFEKPPELFMIVIGGICFNIGLSTVIHSFFPSISIDNLLSNLLMGVAMINSSTKGDASFKALKNSDLPIYTIFFVLAGAKLHIEEFLKGGILFLVYAVGRTIGKYYGVQLGVHFCELKKKLGRHLNVGLFPQAGVAIGLAAVILGNKMESEMQKTLSTVILSSVMFFEIVGPLFTKYSVVKAGEVKEISLSKHRYQATKRRYHRVLIRLRNSLGLTKKTSASKIMCKDIMRSNVEAIEDVLPFDEVLKFASHCKYDQFPVVDQNHFFVGSISYSEIRDILMDPQFAHLIIAKDIMNENPPVAHPEDSLKKLLMLFHSVNDDLDFLAVIDDHDPPHLIGMVTQRDVIANYRGVDPDEDSVSME